VRRQASPVRCSVGSTALCALTIHETAYAIITVVLTGQDTARLDPRWCHADVELRDFAIISWDVEPSKLAALLPIGFEPEVRGGRSMVSMVAFRDHRFHFRAAPFARMSCGQVNYRAYVRRGDQTGVWFFGFSLDSRLVVIPRHLWKMPWHRTDIGIESGSSSAGGSKWRLTAAGSWGAAEVSLRGAGHRLETPSGFADAKDASGVLFDPFLGWYDRRDGSGRGVYRVWHEPLQLEHADVEVATATVFSDLGLIAADQPPSSAGIQGSVRFDVYTPPQRLR
jgi:uncharacterized protein YqjF (DUF2071 family)